MKPSPQDPPHVLPAPTAEEDLHQTRRADRLPGGLLPGYRPGQRSSRSMTATPSYRDLYYRLHAEVDGPIDRVRCAVTEGSADAVLVRTSDHGELLGTRRSAPEVVQPLRRGNLRPFVHHRAGVGLRGTEPRVVDAPTSHVDLVPTLLSAPLASTSTLSQRFCGNRSPRFIRCRDAIPDAGDRRAPADDHRAVVYLMTRDTFSRATPRPGLGPSAWADVPCAATDPDSGAHRGELRGSGGPGRRG